MERKEASESLESCHKDQGANLTRLPSVRDGAVQASETITEWVETPQCVCIYEFTSIDKNKQTKKHLFSVSGC